DLLKAKHEAQLQRWQEIYGGPGYEVIAVSALDSDSLLSLQQILKGKTTLFSGHSGAGKSTLINQLLPDLELKTAKVSDWSGKGMHTTTFAEMFDLPDGGKII